MSLIDWLDIWNVVRDVESMLADAAIIWLLWRSVKGAKS
jgi:hypothetical protein